MLSNLPAENGDALLLFVGGSEEVLGPDVGLTTVRSEPSPIGTIHKPAISLDMYLQRKAEIGATVQNYIRQGLNSCSFNVLWHDGIAGSQRLGLKSTCAMQTLVYMIDNAIQAMSRCQLMEIWGASYHEKHWTTLCWSFLQ